MLNRRPICASLILFLLTFFAMYKETPAQRPVNTTAGSSSPEINYTVSMSRPWTHLLEVEMHVRTSQMPQQFELRMPVWTPGSYLIREYARHVQDFSAKNATNTPLNWRK